MAGSKKGVPSGDPTRMNARKLLALFAVLAMVIAACGDDASDTTGAGGTDETTGDSGEQIEMLVWASRESRRVPDEFADFMERNPNIVVTQDTQSNDDILQQLQRMKDAGQRMPDVINDDGFLIESYVAAGLALPFDEYKARWEAEDPEEYANILPIAWEENIVDGTVYGVSLMANFDVVLYNIALVEATGIDPTSIDSLDGLLDLMRAIKETSPDAHPLTVQALPGTGVTALKTYLSASGAPFEGAVPDLTSPGGLYTLNWFIQAANEDLLPPEAIAWGEDEARGAFLGRNAGLIIDGFAAVDDFAAELDYGTEWGVIPLPASMTGGQKDGNQISNARFWLINAESEHPDEAFQIIQEINATLVDQALNGSVPMRNTAAMADPRLDEIWPFFSDQLREAYTGSASVPAGLNGGEVEGILEQLFGEMVVGTELTAEELAAKYQPLLDDL